MPRVRVTDLFIYPVKSLRGIAVSQASMTYTGLLHDRQWMIVKANGQFVTQRELPRMALIHASMEADRLYLHSHELMPKRYEISIPMEGEQGSEIETTIWYDTCRCIDAGDDVANWLTEALNSPKPLRLVSMANDFRRIQSQPERLGQHGAIFADASPYLFANRDSLEVLNQLLEAEDKPPAIIEQFRPNIVVAGLDPFSEHDYNRIHSSAGKFTLQLHDHCERCTMVAVNPKTGERDPQQEPYPTLARLNAAPDKPKAAAFGENASLLTGDGQNIGVGDWVSIDRELEET